MEIAVSQNPIGFIVLSHRTFSTFIMSTPPVPGRGNPTHRPGGSGQLNQLPRGTKHVMKHFFGQASGLGVIATAVIRVEQGQPWCQFVFLIVRKLVINLLQAQGLDHGLVGDAAQCQHD